MSRRSSCGATVHRWRGAGAARARPDQGACGGIVQAAYPSGSGHVAQHRVEVAAASGQHEQTPQPVAVAVAVTDPMVCGVEEKADRVAGAAGQNQLEGRQGMA